MGALLQTPHRSIVVVNRAGWDYNLASSDGEQVGISDRGTLIAVLVPPSVVGGTGALLATGRVRPATAAVIDLPPARRSSLSVCNVLDDLRQDG